jgi:membrane fusion protein, copper/silver efflux system
LKDGEQVVASGQFLVDSEARLKSVLGAMAAAPAAAPATPGTYTAQGKVESVEPDGITISHAPVPALKWPSMTMGFGKPDPKAFSAVKPGDTVQFEFREGGPMGWELVTVQPAGGDR